MFFTRSNKKIINLFVVSLFILVFLFASRQTYGQLLPYFPYSPTLANPLFNSILTGIPNGLTTPYYPLFSPFSVFNNIGAVSNTGYNSVNSILPITRLALPPQATIAGGLLPFTNPLVNPFLSPYSIAASYFAAALVPADVAGSWAGQWISTFLTAGIITGDLSITLAQVGSDVTGTAVFLFNKILKFGASVVGTVEGNALTLTSTVVTSPLGTMTFDVTFVATVTNDTMEGTYEVINLITGLIAEQGTFTAVRL